jgi:hypothetical protein
VIKGFVGQRIAIKKPTAMLLAFVELPARFLARQLSFSDG